MESNVLAKKSDGYPKQKTLFGAYGIPWSILSTELTYSCNPSLEWQYLCLTTEGFAGWVYVAHSCNHSPNPCPFTNYLLVLVSAVSLLFLPAAAGSFLPLSLQDPLCRQTLLHWITLMLHYTGFFEKHLLGFVSSNFGHCRCLHPKIVILSIHYSQWKSSQWIRILLPKDRYSGPFEIL